MPQLEMTWGLSWVGAVGFTLALLVAVSSGTPPPLIFSTIVVLLAAAYVVLRFKLFSAPSLFAALLVYPLIVPFTSRHVFGVGKYASRGLNYQMPHTINTSVSLGMIAVLTFIIVIEFVTKYRIRLVIGAKNVTLGKQPTKINHFAVYSPAMAVVAILYLLSAYLTTPGPTLLTVDYQTILQNYYPWAKFAGATFLGSWIILYLLYREESDNQMVSRAYYAVTLLGLTWLVLHNRQNESMGVMSLMIIDIFRNRIAIRDVLSSIRGILFMLVGGLFSISQFFVDGFSSGEVSFSTIIYVVKGGDYVGFAGGAHNIYATFLTTIGVFPDQEQYRFGTTFMNYIIQAIPSGVYSLFGITKPPFLSNIIAHHMDYIGGMFILAPYYANFGPLGIVLAGILLGLLAGFAREYLTQRSETTVRTGLAAVVVVASFRAMWYTQLNWIDILQGYILLLGIYLIVLWNYRSAAVAARELTGTA